MSEREQLLREELEKLKAIPCTSEGCCNPGKECRFQCEPFDEWMNQVIPFLYSPLLEEVFQFYFDNHNSTKGGNVE